MSCEAMIRKKALIITDSLGLPRLNPENLSGKDCWTHRITHEKSDYDVYLFSRGGLSSKELVKNINIYFKSYEPEIIIIQLGIVDCAPRALRFSERKIISSIPILRTLIKKTISLFRKEIVKFRKITYVTEKEFLRNLLTFKEEFSDSKIYVVPIAPATPEYEEYSPGVTENINRFNAILDKIFITIDPYDSVYTFDILMSDYHHLNRKGQDLVFQKVKALLLDENV